jgi:DNA-binding LacI/PurR family transcriptional regulator
VISLQAVAEKAGVSTATVSRVVNGMGVVKNSTRGRVLKAIAELNYHPNLHARHLAGAVNKTIGVVVSNLDNPFFLDVYRAVESDCHASGYEVVVANTLYRPEQLTASVRGMIGRRVAGLALIVSEMDESIVEELTSGATPVVLYDVGKAGGHVTKIRVNYRKGIERLIDYLGSLGHTDIGFIGHHSALGPLAERGNALAESALSVNAAITVRQASDTDSLQGGKRAAAELLSTGEPPTAIVCVNDIMAVGALLELRERGLQVPRDISVTGFDDIELAKFCYPALTTVHIPRDLIGHTIFRSLSREDKTTEPAGREFAITPELVVRDSTGPARRSPL